VAQTSLVDRLNSVPCLALAELDIFVARLRHHSAVAGLVVYGSGAEEHVKPASDLDLLLVWGSGVPPFRHVTTRLGSILTELVVVSAEDVRLVASGADPIGEWGADVTIEALRGRILHDPSGVLAEAAARLKDRNLSAPSLAEGFGSWRHAQYNVRQTRRYLASPDPDARLAVEARLLYSFHFLLIHYFLVRGMRWRGDKEALRYWRTHEPILLAEWRTALREPDLDRQVARYEAMHDRVYAPLGGAAPDDVDLVEPGAAWVGDDAPERALRAWSELLRE
jgi:predicted nucleotidyltransferase